MELIDFKKINNVVLKSLNLADNLTQNQLSFIGELYFRFTQFKVGSLYLNLPFFDKENIRHFEKYIKYLDHSFRVYYQDRSISLDDSFIIDFFDNENDILNFSKKQEHVSQWVNESNTIYTPDNIFTPAFYAIGENELSFIKNNIPLYKSIREENLLAETVLIDLDIKNIYIQEEDKMIECFNMALFNDFRIDSSGDTEYFNNTWEEIYRSNSNIQISVKYPYFSNIDSRLVRNDVNSFQVSFRNRFTIREANEILSNDLIIQPNELINRDKPLVDFSSYFDIVQTNAGAKIQELLSSILADWKDLDLNKYLYPFPKYFFLFICKGETIDFWQSLFEKSYPFIVDRPFYKQILELLSLVYELDWSSVFADKHHHFVFPDLDTNRRRSQILSAPYGIFKQYQISISEEVTFSSSINEGKVNIILNSFDINYLLNEIPLNTGKSVKVVVPDFLYYNINPFGIYQLFNYQFISYFTDVREHIFPEIGVYKADCIEHKRIVLDKSRIDLKAYSKSIKPEEDFTALIDEELCSSFDDILDEVEEHDRINIVKQVKNAVSQTISVHVNGEIMFYHPESYVYVYRENFLKIKVFNLVVNDLFLNIDKIKRKMKSDLLHQLDAIPDSVKYFKYDLFLKGDSFKKLRKIGLKIRGEDYFNNSYISSEREFDLETFRLPRKEDRNLICEFLNISPSEMQIAYVAKYKNSKEFKRLYAEVLDILLEGDYINKVNSDEANLLIRNILKSSNIDFSDEYSLEEFTTNVVESILNKLVYYLEPITNLQYEIKS